MCEQLEQEPDPDKIPPDMEDFPEDVQMGIIIFGKLGDKIVADIGYLGKDFTPLPLFMKLAGVENEDICVETILRLDEKVKIKSAEDMRRAREKAKSK